MVSRSNRVFIALRTTAFMPVLVSTLVVVRQSPGILFQPSAEARADAPLPMPVSRKPKFPGAEASPEINLRPYPRRPLASKAVEPGSFGLHSMTGGVLQTADPSPATAVPMRLFALSTPTIGVSAKKADLVAVEIFTNFALAPSVVAVFEEGSV